MFRLFSFLNRINKTSMPKEYKFRGYLDIPQDYEHSHVVAGWYFSKKPFFKVVACLNGEEILTLKPNTVRNDVARKLSEKGLHAQKKTGYTYSIDQGSVVKRLKNRSEKRSSISIRFYINKNNYVEKFKTPFVLANESSPVASNKASLRDIIFAFLPKQRRINIPADHEFIGHLDFPKEGRLSNIVGGWYLTKMPFYKVVLCLNGKEIIKIDQNKIRKDVARLHNYYDCPDKDNSGFLFQIPDNVIKYLLRGRDKRAIRLSIRFYINEHQYAEKFRTKFVLYEDEYVLFRKDREHEYSKIDIKKGIRKFRFKPKISVVVPVYRPSR
jgi:hypothetical protein